MSETDGTRTDRARDGEPAEEAPPLRVEDRRHWARADHVEDDDAADAAETRQPTVGTH